MVGQLKARVYVGGLPKRVSKNDLEQFFRKCGKTQEISIKQGYGFVHYIDYRDAKKACNKLNKQFFKGGRLTVQQAKGDYRDREKGYGRIKRTHYRLIIKNLSSSITWQDLKYFFNQVGKVVYAEAHKYKKNEGFIEFAFKEDMRIAREKFDKIILNSRRIRLVELENNQSKEKI